MVGLDDSAKSKNDFWFWFKYGVLIVIMIVVAIVLVIIQQQQSDAPVAEGKSEQTIHESLSNFYKENIMDTQKNKDPGAIDYNPIVQATDQPLEDRLAQLEAIMKQTDGSNRNYVGEYRKRGFRKNGSMRELLMFYANLEQIQLFWELPEDFIIKDGFQVEGTIMDMMKRVSAAIDPQFEGRVTPFFCPTQRSIVLTDDVHESDDNTKSLKYLTSNCRKLR